MTLHQRGEVARESIGAASFKSDNEQQECQQQQVNSNESSRRPSRNNSLTVGNHATVTTHNQKRRRSFIKRKLSSWIPCGLLSTLFVLHTWFYQPFDDANLRLSYGSRDVNDETEQTEYLLWQQLQRQLWKEDTTATVDDQVITTTTMTHPWLRTGGNKPSDNLSDPSSSLLGQQENRNQGILKSEWHPSRVVYISDDEIPPLKMNRHEPSQIFFGRANSMAIPKIAAPSPLNDTTIVILSEADEAEDESMGFAIITPSLSLQEEKSNAQSPLLPPDAPASSAASTLQQGQEQSLLTQTHVPPATPTCRPMEDWQTQLRSNCNTFHEFDFLDSRAKLLGQGWFRDTWKSNSNNFVLKTLHMEHDFNQKRLERHRRDAMAMEHLTFSPYVLDIYGHCGQSAMNELATGMTWNDTAAVGNNDTATTTTLTSFDGLPAMFRQQNREELWQFKFRLGLSISAGLMHIHHGQSSRPASLVHYDINPANIALMANGQAKFNDFNLAEFLTTTNEKVDETTPHEDCGTFKSKFHEPFWRAPEEMDMTDTARINEKVDVYALGNVLYYILTEKRPNDIAVTATDTDQQTGEVTTVEGLRQMVGNGTAATRSFEELANFSATNRAESTVPQLELFVIEGFRKAINLCLQEDPVKRGTAREVANLFAKMQQEFDTLVDP